MNFYDIRVVVWLTPGSQLWSGLQKEDRLGSIEQNEAEHSEHQGKSYFFKQRRSYYIYQKNDRTVHIIVYPMLYHVLYYHVYIVYDLNHPRSSKFGRMVKLSSSVSNSNFFWKQLTQHLGFSSLATHREGRWSRRCVAAKHHTGPLAVGWLKTLEITVNYSGLCSLPCLPGNTCR